MQANLGMEMLADYETAGRQLARLPGAGRCAAAMRAVPTAPRSTERHATRSRLPVWLAAVGVRRRVAGGA